MKKPTLNYIDFAIILGLFMVGAIVHQKVVAPKLK
jgi:mannose/fructose/N-acetylgalactosamine-specific phosphotransferase system component IID